MRTNIEKELTLVDFFVNFRKFADSKTAYIFAKKMYANYISASNEEKSLYSVENGKIVFDNYAATGSMAFDRNGIHDSGLRTPELWRLDRDHEYFIRWCWYPEC